MKFEYSQQNFENIPNFMKIHLVGAKFSRADGLTDMRMLTVTYRNFANALSVYGEYHVFKSCGTTLSTVT
jgi:hypothetical protein